jgi:hypothetical protein
MFQIDTYIYLDAHTFSVFLLTWRVFCTQFYNLSSQLIFCLVSTIITVYCQVKKQNIVHIVQSSSVIVWHRTKLKCIYLWYLCNMLCSTCSEVTWQIPGASGTEATQPILSSGWIMQFCGHLHPMAMNWCKLPCLVYHYYTELNT